MNLITKEMYLKEVNPDFAKQISHKFGIDEDSVQLIRKGLVPSDLKFTDGESSAIDYITTKSVDRDGDIVEPGGANLTDYMKNPVVLWCHDYKQLPIGKSAWIKSNNDGLVAKTIYAVKSNPFAKQVYEYRKDGFPLAKSIGFVPLKQNPNVTKGVKRHFLEYLVLEYSDCPIPSNPDAIGLAVSKGLIKPAQAKYYFYNMNDELLIDGQSIIDDRYIIDTTTKERYDMKIEQKAIEVSDEEKAKKPPFPPKKDEEEDKQEVEDGKKEELEEEIDDEVKPKEDIEDEEMNEEEKPKKKPPFPPKKKELEEEIVEEKEVKGEVVEEKEVKEEEVVEEKKELEEEDIEEKAKSVEAKCGECGETFAPLDGETICKGCSGKKKKPIKKELEEEEDPTDKLVKELESVIEEKEEYQETIANLQSELKALQEENEGLVDKLDELSYYNQIYDEENTVLKEGRVISGKNVQLIGKCITDMNTAIAALQNLLEATTVSKSIDEEEHIIEIEEEKNEIEEKSTKEESKDNGGSEISEEEIVEIVKGTISKSINDVVSRFTSNNMAASAVDMKMKGKVY